MDIFISTYVNSFGFNGNVLNVPSYLLSKELVLSEDIKCSCSYIPKVLNLGVNAAF